MKKYKISFKGWAIAEVEVKANSLKEALDSYTSPVSSVDFIRLTREGDFVDGSFEVDGVFEAEFKEPKL